MVEGCLVFMNKLQSMDTTTYSLSNSVRPKVGRVPGSSPARKRFTPFTSAPTRKTVIVISVLVLFGFVSALSGNFSNVPVSEALAFTLGGTSAPLPAHESKTIVLKENAGTIIGQFAKITPQEVDQGIEVNRAPRPDKSTREDLLSIVGKY